MPLVLHDGSGMPAGYIRAAMEQGVAKPNFATEIRQAYEGALAQTGDVAAAQAAVYDRTTWVVRDWLGLAGLHTRLELV